ncbi:hypothetical protein [Nocardia yunnanensis]|nr:hypothetical protein [Nocardia yunnanensis]
MATREVVLRLDSVALSLAEAAAQRSQTSVDEVISGCLNRHLIGDYAPGSDLNSPRPKVR